MNSNSTHEIDITQYLLILFLILLGILFITNSNSLLSHKNSTSSKAATPQKKVVPQNTKARIIGGEDAQMGEFPFFTLLISKDKFAMYTCGGVLIGESWVLTAAHCVYDIKNKVYSDVEVFIGIHQLDSQYQALHSSIVDKIEVFDIKELARSDYDKETDTKTAILKDIALLHLQDKAKGVPTVSIPFNKSTLYQSIVNSPGTAVGFGLTQYSSVNDQNYSFPSILKKIPLNINTQSMNKSDLSYATYIVNTVEQKGFMKYVLRSALTNTRPSFGDSGGPLLQQINGKTYVIGIASYLEDNNGDALESAATDFTSVVDYYTWIMSKTGIFPGTGSFTSFDPNSNKLKFKPIPYCNQYDSSKYDCSLNNFLCSWSDANNICYNDPKASY